MQQNINRSNQTNGEPDWRMSPEEIARRFDTRVDGLTATEALRRLKANGPNSVRDTRRHKGLRILFAQFESPLILILGAASLVAAAVGEWREAIIIALVILASCLLSFYQEYYASVAVQQLQDRLASKARVRRDGRVEVIAAAEVVAGDVIEISAGDLVAADARLISATDLFLSQAALTGETFPVEKRDGQVPADAPLIDRTNMVYGGTSVRSGIGAAIVVATGSATELGRIAAHLDVEPPETDFARGIRRFGYLMTRVTLAFVVVIFAGNLLLDRPVVASLLFSLAIAVGLTPELLPAIVSVTLSHGARRMAAGGVIVRRLASIENLGSMNLLCTDKTGTLTEGTVRLERVEGALSAGTERLLRLAALNARLQHGMANPLDDAIDRAASKAGIDTSTTEKIAEIPYDFLRKRLSIVTRLPGEQGDLMISKGALTELLSLSTAVEIDGADQPLDEATRQVILDRYAAWSAKGLRVLGLGLRRFPTPPVSYTHAHEEDLVFAGFLLFADPPKTGIGETLAKLSGRGVAIKVITGDNRLVAAHLAETVGLSSVNIMTGADLSRTSDEALAALAERIDLFAEIDPSQKQRIVAALRRRGHVVGYLGDGINDAPALNEADIGISVEGAVDVARQAADMVLVDKNLDVLLEGIDNGRRTFANTLKYVSITTSANFGNMISMSVASFLLPFQPLLAKQILLNNFLSDIPSLAIATDTVDEASLRRPQRWNLSYIQRFMVVFGLISTVFDFLTFGFLLGVARHDAALFQTGWFVESLISELLIVLVIRSPQPVWRQRPSSWLMGSTLAVCIAALALPYLPGADWFGFVALPPVMMAGLMTIIVGYLVVSELAKRWFFSETHARRMSGALVRRRRRNAFRDLSGKRR